MPEQPTDLPPLWREFPNTILEFYFDGILSVDLRRTISPPLREEILDLGLGEEFSVVTPCNPTGRPATEANNHRAVELFETQLAVGEYRFLRADGVAADGTHRERGAAIAAPLEVTLHTARQFTQLAVFRYEHGIFRIVPTADDDSRTITLPLGSAPPST